MTITPWMIYLVSICDSVCMTTTAAALVGLASLIVMIGMMSSEGRDFVLRMRPWVVVITFATSVFLLLAVFTPSSKAAAAMVVIPAVANNEKLQGLGDNMIKLAEKWVEHLAPKNKDNDK